MQDTFYVDLKDGDGHWLNLRPHTSPMQIRHAQAHARRHAGAAVMPDVRVIAPGRTYRVGQRRDALADVPPGRRPLARRERELSAT
jgi:phenylalanyl-tRNA synthetase alpha subunit